MLRSLYAYKGTHARTLGFQVGEKFVEIGPSRDPNWVHVISERGAVGYVPKNYITSQDAQPVEMLEFIDGCIEATHLNASARGGNYSRGEHDALHRLVELRQEWFAKCPPSQYHNKRPAPPPPQGGVDSLPTPSPVEIFGPSSSVPSSVSSAREASSAKAEPSTGKVGETSTSFMARGDSLAREESSGSSEGHDNSIGYGSEKRSEADFGAQVNIRSLLGQVQGSYLRLLVEEVRSNTSISYTTSHQVVEVVLNSLGATIPALQPLCSHILTSKEEKRTDGEATWQQSSDGRHLVELLEKLRECKDDEQQRSWALHEDEFTITSHLTDLLDLLNNGDLEVCRTVLSLDDYRPLLTLVQYYQMETRWPLRKLLLKVFGAVCQMSAANISYLSASVFPVELTREMLEETCSDERLQYTSLVLGMVLSMGDTLPYPHFCVMNEKFLSVLLEGIEQYNEDPDMEQLAELYLALVLAFNLQYVTPQLISETVETSTTSQSGISSAPSELNGDLVKERETATNSIENTDTNTIENVDSENIVIKLLSQRSNTKYFSEKLLLLFNREEDPLAMFDHEPRPPHSVLKMMRDMYSTRTTAAIFYTNDEKVVCDIIIRQLSDLPADDKRRNEYLHLLEGVMVTGGWTEHQHRQEEVISTCANILGEEEPAALQDQKLIRRIKEKYPTYFNV